MHPYSRFAGLLLKGSMSLDFRVATLPYKSSSFATLEGEVLAVLCLKMLMSPKAERRVNLPPPGWQANVICNGAKRPENHVRRFPVERCRRQKGCISIGRSPVVRFSIPRSGIIKLIAAKRRYHNPRAEGPSNFRTLAPTGRINLKNLLPQPFYTTCRRQAAQPLRLQAHQPPGHAVAPISNRNQRIP